MMGWILPPLILVGAPLVFSAGSLRREKFQYASRRIQDPAFLESAALEDKGGRSYLSFMSPSSICWCTKVMRDCGFQMFNSILKSSYVTDQLNLMLDLMTGKLVSAVFGEKKKD